MILIFQFINVLFHIESFLHPWDKPHLIIVYDPLNVLLKLICWYFVEVFLHVCLSVILVCDFLFSNVFVWFWYQDNACLENEFGSITSFAVFFFF